MDAALERLVWQRAHDRCEYGQMPQEYDELVFEIDHIIPRKHGGPTTAENLALACFFWIPHSYCLPFELVGILGKQLD